MEQCAHRWLAGVWLAGVWLAGRSWAGVAHLLAGISGAGQVQHRGGHTPVWPAAPPAPAATTTRGGPPAAC